jgi:hypothetical protein
LERDDITVDGEGAVPFDEVSFPALSVVLVGGGVSIPPGSSWPREEMPDDRIIGSRIRTVITAFFIVPIVEILDTLTKNEDLLKKYLSLG